MVMTKAFDVTMHSLLFSKMLKAGLSAIFLWLLIFIYTEQFANVRWNGVFSKTFSMHVFAKGQYLVLLLTASTVSNSSLSWNSAAQDVG